MSLVLDEVVRVPWADAVGALVIAVIVAREGWASVQAAAGTSRSRPTSLNVFAGLGHELPAHEPSFKVSFLSDAGLEDRH